MKVPQSKVNSQPPAPVPSIAVVDHCAWRCRIVCGRKSCSILGNRYATCHVDDVPRPSLQAHCHFHAQAALWSKTQFLEAKQAGLFDHGLAFGKALISPVPIAKLKDSVVLQRVVCFAYENHEEAFTLGNSAAVWLEVRRCQPTAAAVNVLGLAPTTSPRSPQHSST